MSGARAPRAIPHRCWYTSSTLLCLIGPERVPVVRDHSSENAAKSRYEGFSVTRMMFGLPSLGTSHRPSSTTTRRCIRSRVGQITQSSPPPLGRLGRHRGLTSSVHVSKHDIVRLLCTRWIGRSPIPYAGSQTSSISVALTTGIGTSRSSRLRARLDDRFGEGPAVSVRPRHT